MDRPYFNAAHYILQKFGSPPEWVVTLGSGFGNTSDNLNVTKSLQYSDIPDLPIPTIDGHRGVLQCVESGNTAAWMFLGRNHLYEGLNIDQCAAHVWIASHVGARGIILCSTCGAVDYQLKPGSIFIADCLLNFQNITYAGMGHSGSYRTNTSQARLINRLEKAAQSAGIMLSHGTLACVFGPSYETGAEVEALSRARASAVTMSAGAEYLTAKNLNLPAVALGCVTNPATGVVRDYRPDHSEVLSVADSLGSSLSKILSAFLEDLET